MNCANSSATNKRWAHDLSLSVFVIFSLQSMIMLMTAGTDAGAFKDAPTSEI